MKTLVHVVVSIASVVEVEEITENNALRVQVVSEPKSLFAPLILIDAKKQFDDAQIEEIHLNSTYALVSKLYDELRAQIEKTGGAIQHINKPAGGMSQ